MTRHLEIRTPGNMLVIEIVVNLVAQCASGVGNYQGRRRADSLAEHTAKTKNCTSTGMSLSQPPSTLVMGFEIRKCRVGDQYHARFLQQKTRTMAMEREKKCRLRKEQWS